VTDLEMLAELAERTAPPTAEALASARARLVAELRAGTPTPAGRLVPARRPVRRLVLPAGIAAGLVAVATAGLVTLTTTPHGAGPARVSAAAAEVLDRAAGVARSEADVPPGPDQFLYVRSVSGSDVYEAWFSMDGTHDGRIKPLDGGPVPVAGCRDGRAPVVKGTEFLPGVTEPCTPDPAYLPDVPTTADGMLAYLRRAAGGDRTNDLAKVVFWLAEQRLLRPSARAALFEAAKQIPNVTVAPDATDGAGRPGVGVSWTYSGPPVSLVFDRSTYQLLGSNLDSLQRKIVVNRVGQRA